MTRVERRGHLAAWLILGPLCVALLLLALTQRSPDVTAPTWPAASGGTP